MAATCATRRLKKESMSAPRHVLTITLLYLALSYLIKADVFAKLPNQRTAQILEGPLRTIDTTSTHLGSPVWAFQRLNVQLGKFARLSVVE
jgi:hypothetical protein